MYVFREGRRRASSGDLRRALLASLHARSQNGIQRLAVEGLLRAGELECALADCNAEQHDLAAGVTDLLAAQILAPNTAILSSARELLERLSLPGEVVVSVAEGFAYYALHPSQYVQLADTIPISASSVAVVGIRSIGTTLSAVVKAALHRRGLPAERITVRPEGHPFDRVTVFSSWQRDWITQQQARDAHFLVVDEGPGLSGSSFLSTAEALTSAGVAPERVSLLCARQPNPTALCARDAAQRAGRFTWFTVPSSSQLPEEAGHFVGAGRWRAQFADNNLNWPASWTNLERAKFLSRDGKRLYKFEGLGHYGSAVHARARLLQDSGYSPRLAAGMNATGYAAYELSRGQNLHGVPVLPRIIDAVARYCAFRARAFECANHEAESNRDNLQLMLLTNFSEEFGSAPDSAASLQIERPVIADGRMQPWEWAMNGDRLIKFDAVSHGDDHFFPGPVDIAWDLAGAVVEFALHSGTRESIESPLLERYQKYSGDDASSRLHAYLLAYAAFRLGYCKMAADAMQGSEEEPRLRREYVLYRDLATQMLAQRVAA